MKKIVLSLVVLLAFTLYSCKTETEKKKESIEQVSKIEYMCPMDCEEGKTYEKPEKCPVCKMKLVDKKKLKQD